MDWNTLRQQMPVTERWAYFDHAAVAPLTERAHQALVEWAEDLTTHGETNLSRWETRVEEVRRLCGQLINAEPLDIAFTKNTSEGIGFVAEGFPWQAGDNLVTAADEYPTNLYPWMNLAGRGVVVRMVSSSDGRILLDDLQAAMDDRTRLVSLSFVEFATGFRNDLEAVGRLCRERGIFFFVDAIQGLGVLPLDVQRMAIDGLSSEGHKWLLGPQGAGLFYLRRDWVDRLHTVSVGWNSVVGCRDFSHIDFRLKPHAGRWENGTLNFAGLHAFGASLELLLGIGVAAVAERLLTLTDYLCAEAQKAGLTVYSSRRTGEQSGIVSLIVPGADLRTLVRRCRAEGIIINQRAGRIRVSPHCYNTVEEIDRLLRVLRTQDRQ
jgi:selenocysteine lyase/cysteine desulfurase